MTVIINMHKTMRSCHGYEGIMSVLCTPLQVKCYQTFVSHSIFHNNPKGKEKILLVLSKRPC